MNIMFWNVDTQRDFMMPGGRLYIKGAEDIIGKLQDLTNFAQEHRLNVTNTADYHSPSTKEISDDPDFKTTFPVHCMAGDQGQDFIPQTDPRDFKDNYCIVMPNQPVDLWKFHMSRNIVIFKDAFDVFDPVHGNQNTDEVLNQRKPDLVVVYGVAADVCVNFAVLGLLHRGYDVVVAIDAIKALDDTPVSKYNLYTNWLMQGAWLASVEYIKKFVVERIVKEYAEE